MFPYIGELLRDLKMEVKDFSVELINLREL